MRNFKLVALGFMIVGAGGILLAQTMKPDHEKTPRSQEPSPYMSASEIQEALAGLDPKLLALRTGGAIEFARGKADGVVRRRITGPQYAVAHTRTLEYIIVIKGTATMVTGGTLIPPTTESVPIPNVTTIRSELGVQGGLARKVGPGDVIVNLPATPHWFSQIDGAIDYFEIVIPNVDPAPESDRAKALAAPK